MMVILLVYHAGMILLSRDHLVFFLHSSFPVPRRMTDIFSFQGVHSIHILCKNFNQINTNQDASIHGGPCFVLLIDNTGFQSTFPSCGTLLVFLQY